MPAIKAASPWNDTGITLQAGQSYRLAATGIWHDAWNACDPDGYKSNNPLLTWTEHLRRAPSQDWFVLMGAIGHDPATIFRIGSAAEITPTASGQLCCFANDIPWMYWNNWGAVEVTVVS